MDKLKESGWFEIFRTGTWHGQKYEKEHLDEMVKNFQSGDPVPPLIIGHNTFMSDEKPAEGWVCELKRQGNRLMCKARNISARLVEAVNEEVYPMRSVELWSNWREKGGWALSAVAFLGGSNPEVGNMEMFTFAAHGQESVGHAEHDGRVRLVFSASDGLGDPKDFKYHHNTEGGENEMTKEEIEALLKSKLDEQATTFSAQIQTLTTANEQLQTSLQASTAQVTAQTVAANLDRCQRFCSDLLSQRRITPAVMNGGLVAFMASLDSNQKVKFGATEQSQLECFQSLMKELPQANALFSAVTPAEGDTTEVEGVVAQFAAKYGLPPEVVSKQFSAVKQGQSGMSVSIAAPTPTA